MGVTEQAAAELEGLAEAPDGRGETALPAEDLAHEAVGASQVHAVILSPRLDDFIDYQFIKIAKIVKF